jgi:endonuclease/exonuclease/phosphatase family metal-dependent hydrolase
VLRVMTYNVHGCVGVDRRLDPGRIASVIEACAADVVALQELDVGRTRSGGVDQPREIADRLGMHLEFCSARECDGGRYGNAVLSRHPAENVRGACLPQHGRGREPRALQWVRIHAPVGSLNVLNTHLGLDVRERLLQTAAILGKEWIDHARATGATVLCGDFNAAPRSAVYKQLTGWLRDAQLSSPQRGKPRGTFPSFLPLLRIDHVLVSPELTVREARVVSERPAKIASDHLPIVVDLDLTEAGS